MKYDPQKHRRRSIQPQGYDYARAGAYFVTDCAQGRVGWFGEVVDGQMRLHLAGQTITAMWRGVPEGFSGIAMDVHGVMPNHLHGIVWITPAGVQFIAPHTWAGVIHRAPRLGEIVRAFKAVTAHTRGQVFPELVWQRNYYEYAIGNVDALNRIREYITTNPLQWALDRENPEFRGRGGVTPPLPERDPWR